jgi:hypothetical protein
MRILPTIKGRALLTVLCCLITLGALAQFGGFTDQPFLGRIPEGGPCAGINFHYDSFETYTTPVVLHGQDEGCNWTTAYVVHADTNLPSVIHIDSMDSYTAADPLTGLNGGIDWSTAYFAKTYAGVPLMYYVDAGDEYTAGSSLANLVGGTNYFWYQGTNHLTNAQWSQAYVPKDY